MSAAATIAIEARLNGERARDVAIRSGGPSAARAFVGAASGDVPGRAASLFALCPVAQASAASLAIETAQGKVATLPRTRTAALYAEHVAENLRSLVLGWPGVAPDSMVFAALREALTALRGVEARDAGSALQRLEAATDALRNLGLADEPAPHASAFGRILRAAHDDATIREAPLPVLQEGAADDAAMLAWLPGGDGAMPVPALRETGADALLRARAADLRRIVALLAGLLRDEQADPPFAATCPAAGVGVAAVSSPRGRLFHCVALDRDGRVANYRIVAPTDRNFAADGPFVQALTRARFADRRDAETSIARLAALYDPCVAFHVRLRESADA